MIPKSRQLLKEAGRGWELLLGWACGLISLLFAGALVYFLYVVGWRNPRRYGSQDLVKADTLAILAMLLVIALVFSTFACRLLQKPKPNVRRRLMSPLVLRVWGVFFLLGAMVICLDAIVHQHWQQLLHLWHVLAGSVSMAIAAFVLAKKWEKERPTVRR